MLPPRPRLLRARALLLLAMIDSAACVESTYGTPDPSIAAQPPRRRRRRRHRAATHASGAALTGGPTDTLPSAPLAPSPAAPATAPAPPPEASAPPPTITAPLPVAPASPPPPPRALPPAPAAAASSPPTPLRAPSLAAPPATTAASAEGELDAGLVAAAIRARVASIRRCYEYGLEHEPTLRGRLDVRFTIDLTGHVSAISYTGLPTAPWVGRCVAAVIQEITFAAPTGGSVDFSFPFNFTPAP